MNLIHLSFEELDVTFKNFKLPKVLLKYIEEKGIIMS